MFQDQLQTLPELIARCLTQHQERVDQRRNFLHPDTAAASTSMIPTTPSPLLIPQSRYYSQRTAFLHVSDCHPPPNLQFLFARCPVDLDTAVPVAHQSDSAAHLQPHAAPGARDAGAGAFLHGHHRAQQCATAVVGVGGVFVGVGGNNGGGAQRQYDDIQTGAQLNRSPGRVYAGSRVGAWGLVASRIVSVVAVVASFPAVTPAAAAAATAEVVAAVAAAAVLVLVVAIVALIFRLVQVAELIQHVVLVVVVAVVADVLVVVAQPTDQVYKEAQPSRHERGHHQLFVILNAPIANPASHSHNHHNAITLPTIQCKIYLVCYLYIYTRCIK